MKESWLMICLLCVAANAQTPEHKSMVRIPGGTFPMGTDASKVSEIAKAFNISKHPDLIQAETPRHTVTISSFWLDKYEVTNRQFRDFIRKHPEWRQPSPSERGLGKRVRTGSDFTLSLWERLGEGAQHSDRVKPFPSGKANHPVTNVTWYTAVAFCQHLGKRLPTEAEWEFAARGGLRDKTFPWGDEPVDKTRANYAGSGLNATAPVGSYPANGYGLFDMAGNVWEFLADEWELYSDQPQTNPVAGGDLFQTGSKFHEVTTRRVIRGGSYAGAPLNLRVTYRDSHPPDGAREFVGFRCAES